MEVHCGNAYMLKNKRTGAGEMAPSIGELDALAEALDLVARTHMLVHNHL